MLRTFSASGWARAKSRDARPGNLSIGIALGSGYQNYFAALSASAQQAEIAKMRAAGITWIRMDVEWWTVEPTQGAYDWSNPDVTADAMLAGGMNLVILLNTSPVWARRAANTAPLYSPWPTTDPQRYAQYCAQAATHYSAKGIHVFELWNEPNLNLGPNTAAGWGQLSPWGYADLAVAAYPAIKTADPKALVLGGTLATSAEFGTAGTARTVSWAAVPAGATSATISCPSAVSGDAYGHFTADGWPIGTVITAATAGVGYTVNPPVWLSGFPAIAAGTGRTAHTSNVQFPPDVFLTQAYARAAGQTMWDALAIHPYTQPVLPAAQQAIKGGWATIPTLRQIMKDHGEGAKTMWMTEIGAPSGAATASWPTTGATATTLTISSPTAAAADIGYQVDTLTQLLPVGTHVTAVTPGDSWKVMPPVGTVSADIAKGTAITSIPLAATATVLNIPAQTTLTIMSSPTPLSVTTTSAVTTSTSATTTVPISSVTPNHSYSAESVVRGSVGQSWGRSIAAATSQAITLTPPGVVPVYGQVDEATQAAIITQVFQSITSGVPAGSGSLGSEPWPYIGPVFLFCWSDAGGTAGPFGLVRADGTPKAALTALTTVSHTGGF